ncbi:MAG: CBS domain-containing protein [Candidatus Kuenenia sp.]|nr:CBS domain-containing protein [Candidatus Kuenenia hertensis]
MFGRGISLFKIFNFQIRVDASWFIIALLVAWSLAHSFFPHYYKGLSNVAYWWMGIAGVLGLFASIIFHELCHSLVARRFGMAMRGITLFIFGGVAEMEEDPPSAKAEFSIAIAGPASSVALGFAFYGIYCVIRKIGLPLSIAGVLNYLFQINLILAVFNLIPAFPLDGGRVFRSILWSWKGNLRWATRISAHIGSGFGFFLIFLGILYIINGAFISGIWIAFIGLFLRKASQLSYQKLIWIQNLAGESVQRFMRRNPMTAPPEITLAEIIENYFYKYHFKLFPVVKDGKFIGFISTREIKNVPKEEWNQHTVEEFLQPYSTENTIPPDADATKALLLMSKTGNSRLMVIEGERLIGIITLKDLLQFLSLKLNLEEEDF